jgi:hypothetical protein
VAIIYYTETKEVDQFMLVCCLIYSSTMKIEAICFSGMIFKELHGFISQKTELFITTAVSTSNPTKVYVHKWIRGSVVG